MTRLINLLLVYAWLPIFSLYSAEIDPQVILNEAEQSYREGEKASTIAERREKFNHALKLYAQLEEQYHPTLGDGKLYYNLANTYYQLAEYPWAAFYYYRAVTLMPRDEKVKNNLIQTLNKLNVDVPAPPSVINKYFLWRTLFSPAEYLQIFFALSVFVILFLSIAIWRGFSYLKGMLIVVFCAWLWMLAGLIYLNFMAPIEAVMVRPTLLYRDAGLQYAAVTNQPILAGTKVQVLGAFQDGHWLEILTPNETLGYVPSTTIRVLNK